MRELVIVLPATAAALIEGEACRLAIVAAQPSALLLPAALHSTAIMLCVLVTTIRGATTPVDRATVALCAAFLPLVGPALAWAAPRSQRSWQRSSSRDLHEGIEAGVETSSPSARKIVTGDFERDLSRELDAMSYHEVLISGDLDQKRNAIRALARMGGTQNLQLVKRMLVDPDAELRLCAYLELDRLRTGFERRIDEARKSLREIEAREGAGSRRFDEAAVTLAQLHGEFAGSGAVDDDMAHFHLGQAVAVATQSTEVSADNWRAVLIAAQAHCDMGNFAEAEHCLDQLPQAAAGHVAIRVLRGRLCFSRRDFDGAREQAIALRDTGAPVPEWMSVLIADEDDDQEDDDGMLEPLIGEIAEASP